MTETADRSTDDAVAGDGEISKRSRMYRNDTKVPFDQYWKRVLLVSAALILISVFALVVRGVNLGLEFEGGAAWELPANGVSTSDARDTLRDFGLADARIQTGDDVLRIRAELDAEDAKVDDVTVALAALAGVPETDVSVNTAGPSWGDEITDKAVQALIVFFIVIAAYITVRLRWQMAVGALVAVAHGDHQIVGDGDEHRVYVVTIAPTQRDALCDRWPRILSG